MYNKNYGLIKGNGDIVLEFSGEGKVYKNVENFEAKEGVCYVAENGVGDYHEDGVLPNVKDVDVLTYTYRDFIELTGGNEVLARRIFNNVSWENPGSYLEGLDMYETCDKCGYVYDVELDGECLKCNKL